MTEARPRQNLRIPGPTPCPPEVLEVMSWQMINHRGKEFAELIRRITGRLKMVFQTKGDVFVLTCSGTGSVESAVVNTLSPGDRVLAISNGFFGDRFTEVAKAYGAEVVPLPFPWGKGVDPEAVRNALRRDPGIIAVTMVHNETSTGVTNNLAAVGRVVKEFDKLFLVDAISSLGCIDVRTDDWGCDVLVTGSQKGFMVPPGLAMVCVNPKAWQAHAKAKMPRYYFDYTRAKNFLEASQTPWTPSVSVFYALDRALALLEEEGLANVFARHVRVAELTRREIKALGLSLLADGKDASNTVTAVNVPPGVDGGKLLQILRDEYQIVLAGGQGIQTGKIFRIGHLGYVDEVEIREVISSLRVVLPRLGFPVPAR